MTYEKEYSTYKTRDDLVGFLCDGSPKLRHLLHVIFQTYQSEIHSIMQVHLVISLV